MHCPSCGAETTLDQRYCRSCGMDLATVSKLVAAHASPEALKLEKALSKKAGQERMYHSMKWGLSLFILAMAALFTTKTLDFPKSYNLIGGTLLFLGMGLMCYSLLAGMRAAASGSRRLPASGKTSELPEAETTRELPFARMPVPVPSITERTTQLIASEKTGMPRE